MAKLVLAINGDKQVHHIVEEALAGFCKVIYAKDGDKGLQLANEYNPDIILLDTEMSELSGYEACKILKENKNTQDIPVMLISSKIALNDRVKGYSVGASDYITKPFNTEDLISRIKVLYEYKQKCVRLKIDMVKANKTAEIATIESSDTDRIMRFVGQSYHANNFQLLSDYFLAFFTPLNLNVVVVFWCKSKGIFYSRQSAVCPLEQELLEQHRQAERFIDIGCSTIINYPKISLLIKNMPLENTALCKRFKGLFPHILEVTNEKVVTMERSESSYEQAAQISTALQDIVKQLNTQNIAQNTTTKEFIEQLHALDCAIQQQKEQTSAADLTLYVSQLDQTMQLFASANSDLAFIKYQLKQVTESRNELLANLRSKAQAAQRSNNHHSDIELF